MKGILLSFILLLTSFAAAAQANDTQQQRIDSLLNVIATSGGEDKQNAYVKLLSEDVSVNLSQDSVSLLYNEGIREMRRQGNKKQEGRLKFVHINCLFNKGLKQEVMATAPDYLKYLAENEQWELYYQMYQTLLETYMEEYMFETAIRKARELYDEANSKKDEDGMSVATLTMGDAYCNLARLEDAEEYYKKTISILSRRENPGVSLYAYFSLVEILSEQKRFAEAQEWLQEYNKAVDRLEALKKRPMTISRNSLYIMQAVVYLDMKEFDKAEPFIDLAEEMLPGVERSMVNIMRYRAEIAESRKDYPRALELCNEAVRLCKASAAGFHLRWILQTKARILAKMLNAEEIVAVYEEHIALRDSFEMRKNQVQLDELRTQYDVDRHVAEKERNRLYFLFALGGCLLLAVALGIWVFCSRKIAEKNRALTEQIQELTAQQEARDKELLSKTTFVEPEAATDIDDSESLCPESRKDKLCREIRDFILLDKAYLNPSINRDYIIDHLGTNRELFVDAFMACFGMSFTDYINGLRLKDAITMLEESDFSIEDIAGKTGFGTIRTFQRQFQNKYRITPKEFRSAARKGK
ncbi:MAG: helix-turn-helix domain-containing protein [Tannerellaceae bacterium]|jgi:AraC-like DNA-binding protein|nr:helix-turn-helix domain-containing protein [Tannerellaceae bacterium]